MICGKSVSVPLKLLVKGMIVEACRKCSKYGEKIEVTEIDDFIDHTYLWRIIKTGKE